jgi:L-amino acid N-acyltransferase YncA
MPNRTDVRLATSTDAEFLIPLNAPLSETAIRRKITDEEILIAAQDSRRVAFMRIGLLWSLHPFIELIVVPEEGLRGRGIGTALLRALEERYAAASEYVYSSCVTSEERPQRWHRSRGFEDCGYLAQLNEGNEGEIFFRKRIGSTA